MHHYALTCIGGLALATASPAGAEIAASSEELAGQARTANDLVDDLRETIVGLAERDEAPVVNVVPGSPRDERREAA